MFFLLLKALVTPCLVFSIGINIFSAVRNWHVMCMCYSNTISTHTLHPQKNEGNKLMAQSRQKLLALDFNKMLGQKKYKICPKWWCKMVNYYSRVRKLTWQPLENHQYLLGNTSSNGCFSRVMLAFRTKNQGCVQISCMLKIYVEHAISSLGSKVNWWEVWKAKSPQTCGFRISNITRSLLNDSDLRKDTVVGKLPQIVVS